MELVSLYQVTTLTFCIIENVKNPPFGIIFMDFLFEKLSSSYIKVKHILSGAQSMLKVSDVFEFLYTFCG